MKTEQELCTLLGDLLSEGGECEWIEFKENYANPQEIGEYLSALSNSALLCGRTHGYLVFGIRDNSLKVVGTNFSIKKEKKGNEELEHWLKRGLKPPTHFKCYELEHSNCKVVVLEVEASIGIPVAFSGKEFIRIGSYKKALKGHPDLEEKIWAARRNVNFAEEIAIDDLEAGDLFQWLDYPKYFELLNSPLPSDSELISKLSDAGFIKVVMGRGLGITNLGAILFARDLNKFGNLISKSVRVIVYDGKNKTRVLTEQEGVKGYAVGLEGLVKYINDRLPVSEEIGNIYRKEIREYSELAVRELAVNMIMHQDFSIRGAGPKVEIFDGRIEFINPGNSLVEPLRLIDGEPRSRNEQMGRTMRKMNLCEERGSGIDKVIEEVESLYLPAPEFVEGSDFFKVTLYAPKTLKEMSKDDKIRACYQHCCLRYLSREKMTNSSLRERFSLPESNRSSVSRIISDALDAKLIRKTADSGKSSKMSSYIPFWA